MINQTINNTITKPTLFTPIINIWNGWFGSVGNYFLIASLIELLLIIILIKVIFKLIARNKNDFKTTTATT